MKAIKEFLKPNRWKVGIWLIILFLAILVLTFQYYWDWIGYYLAIPFGRVIGYTMAGTLDKSLGVIGEYMFFPFSPGYLVYFDFVNFINPMVVFYLILWYFIICFIYFIITKIKRLITKPK